MIYYIFVYWVICCIILWIWGGYDEADYKKKKGDMPILGAMIFGGFLAGFFVPIFICMSIGKYIYKLRRGRRQKK